MTWLRSIAYWLGRFERRALYEIHLGDCSAGGPPCGGHKGCAICRRYDDGRPSRTYPGDGKCSYCGVRDDEPCGDPGREGGCD